MWISEPLLGIPYREHFKLKYLHINSYKYLHKNIKNLYN